MKISSSSFAAGVVLFLGTCVAAHAQNADPQEEPVYAIAEVMPEFPGGQPALRKYLMQNMEFPESALDLPVNGPIQLSFVVHQDGSIADAHIVHGQNAPLDAEALRLVKAMPPWIPGKQRGRTVSVLYTMPIRFASPVPVEQPPVMVQEGSPGGKSK